MIATRSWGGDNEIECKINCHGGIRHFSNACVPASRGGSGKNVSRR
jgi:hypothetical protein